jgi:hypothetical protein
MIETLSEGLLSELLFGMKGKMNAIRLNDLGIKTRHGLMGRALTGKCAGDKAYCYANFLNAPRLAIPSKGTPASFCL